MAATAIQVKHEDGRTGHVFHETEILPDKTYWFRTKTSPSHGSHGEWAFGKKLTQIKK